MAHPLFEDDERGAVATPWRGRIPAPAAQPAATRPARTFAEPQEPPVCPVCARAA